MYGNRLIALDAIQAYRGALKAIGTDVDQHTAKRQAKEWRVPEHGIIAFLHNANVLALVMVLKKLLRVGNIELESRCFVAVNLSAVPGALLLVGLQVLPRLDGDIA